MSWITEIYLVTVLEGRILEIKMSAGLVSSKASPSLASGWLSAAAMFICSSFCVFFIRTPVILDEGLLTYLSFNYLLRYPVSQYSHILRSWKLDLNTGILERQSSVHSIKQGSSALEKSYNLKCFLVRMV